MPKFREIKLKVRCRITGDTDDSDEARSRVHEVAEQLLNAAIEPKSCDPIGRVESSVVGSDRVMDLTILASIPGDSGEPTEANNDLVATYAERMCERLSNVSGTYDNIQVTSRLLSA